MREAWIRIVRSRPEIGKGGEPRPSRNDVRRVEVVRRGYGVVAELAVQDVAIDFPLMGVVGLRIETPVFEETFE